VSQPAPPLLSLPAAKDLRERAAKVGERAALAGTPRVRFLRELRNGMLARLLPMLAMIAVATGAAALTNMFAEPRWLSLAQGLTATVVALLALATTLARRNLVALNAIATAAAAVVAIGWGLVIAFTGGVTSPYALAVPLGITLMVVTIPFPPFLAPIIAAIGVVAVAVTAPGSPTSMYLVLLFVGGGGYLMARTRRKRRLAVFRRIERLAAAVARMRRVQEQLVVVEKLEALRVLVGGMAHELNNALAIALASTEQVTKVAERDAAAAIKAANRAQGGLVRIRGTIDKLRRFAMAEGQVLEPADVQAMLDFALESAIGRARSGVVIERSFAPDVGTVECHVAALAEALYQVSRNAIESMPKGGTVRASVRREGDRVVLAVADEGKGIPPQRLARVFDPFYARESNDATFQGGKLLGGVSGRSGMGLSAVYGLVSSMGGKVEIKSEVGKGTEVAIVLPARPR
jgi:signal transduction histidine kinase